MVKNRKRRVTDDLLKRMLELLTLEEYAELVEGVTTVRVDPNTFVKILVSAITDPMIKPILVEFVKNRLGSVRRARAKRELFLGIPLLSTESTLNELLAYIVYSSIPSRVRDLRDKLIDEFDHTKARHMLKAFPNSLQ